GRPGAGDRGGRAPTRDDPVQGPVVPHVRDAPGGFAHHRVHGLLRLADPLPVRAAGLLRRLVRSRLDDGRARGGHPRADRELVGGAALRRRRHRAALHGPAHASRGLRPGTARARASGHRTGRLGHAGPPGRRAGDGRHRPVGRRAGATWGRRVHRTVADGPPADGSGNGGEPVTMPMSTAPMLPMFTAPVLGSLDPVGRDEAREAARRELEKQVYRRDEPSWIERGWDDCSEWLQDLLSRSPGPESQGSGGGLVSVIVIIIVVAVAVGLVVWLMWGRRNPRSRRDALLEDEPSTALGHREAAERHAAAGEWARALGVGVGLSARPGRTADELAEEAGEAVPELAGDLRAGVRIFDDVWYGDRPGTAEGYARLKDLDERLQAARPRPLEDS